MMMRITEQYLMFRQICQSSTAIVIGLSAWQCITGWQQWPHRNNLSSVNFVKEIFACWWPKPPISTAVRLGYDCGLWSEDPSWTLFNGPKPVRFDTHWSNFRQGDPIKKFPQQLQILNWSSPKSVVCLRCNCNCQGRPNSIKGAAPLAIVFQVSAPENIHMMSNK